MPCKKSGMIWLSRGSGHTHVEGKFSYMDSLRYEAKMFCRSFIYKLLRFCLFLEQNVSFKQFIYKYVDGNLSVSFLFVYYFGAGDGWSLCACSKKKKQNLT